MKQSKHGTNYLAVSVNEAAKILGIWFYAVDNIVCLEYPDGWGEGIKPYEHSLTFVELAATRRLVILEFESGDAVLLTSPRAVRLVGKSAKDLSIEAFGRVDCFDFHPQLGGNFIVEDVSGFIMSRSFESGPLIFRSPLDKADQVHNCFSEAGIYL